MHLNRGEKKLMIGACLVACLLGSLAGRAAYEEEEDAQRHGGVLEEDVAEARFTLAWESIAAFAQWGGGSLLLLGVAPIAVRRILGGRRK